MNRWLFNEDTVDKVLQFVMENVKTDMGDRWQDHRVCPQPQLRDFHRGKLMRTIPIMWAFARVIDNYAKYPGSLIEEFSDKDELRCIS